MQIQLANVVWSASGLMAGALIGAAFGMIQDAARRRNERLQQNGSLTNGWAVMPGSMRRVAYLLVALAFIQFVCPLLFVDGLQWWVSGGVVAGYGWMLYKQLRARLAARI
jgi:hypothetical protein